MAKKLTGMDIFKLLPKTNCGECGVATCMAFAMRLAQKNAELSQCPYASDEAKKVIGAASEPPMRCVKIGSGDRQVQIGSETVMFRHDKTFVHQTVLAFLVRDTMEPAEIEKRASELESYCIVRVGETLRVEMICVENSGADEKQFVAAATLAAAHFKGGIILKSGSSQALIAAATAIQDRVPLLYAVIKENIAELGSFSVRTKLPVCVCGRTIDDVFELSQQLLDAGQRDIVLDVPAENPAALIQQNTVMRKAALVSSVKPLGYPLINFITGRASVEDMVADASSMICKYASVLVIDRMEKEAVLPLLMLRQNIYTDPQKPIQVDPGIYRIGEATPGSPFVVTTNFSLTYFIVSGELENAGIPVNLVIVDCEGMSVLTAWAARKFNGEKIGAFLKSRDVDKQYTTRKIIIPGYVASISGELEEALPGWEVCVGPQEASDITPFMKRFGK
jgi:acetyl-CoA decarbonylase/synthase, CODH/ACS complex subunit gamma